jgi:hypothetical protein
MLSVLIVLSLSALVLTAAQQGFKPGLATGGTGTIA